MVAIGAPDLTTAFLVAAIVPLILGLIVGFVIKAALKIGIAIAVIIVILIVLGILTPDQVLKPLVGAIKSGMSSGALSDEVQRVASYLPYSSLAFIIGLLIGLWRG
jgi:uncharacterized protein YqfA (UPF0365 family)